MHIVSIKTLWIAHIFLWKCSQSIELTARVSSISDKSLISLMLASDRSGRSDSSGAGIGWCHCGHHWWFHNTVPLGREKSGCEGKTATKLNNDKPYACVPQHLLCGKSLMPTHHLNSPQGRRPPWLFLQANWVKVICSLPPPQDFPPLWEQWGQHQPSHPLTLNWGYHIHVYQTALQKGTLFPVSTVISVPSQKAQIFVPLLIQCD